MKDLRNNSHGKGKNNGQKTGKKRALAGICLLLLLTLPLAGREVSQNVISQKPSALNEKECKCVVVDAGHGGIDPGKVGINGALEKDINLEIALLVRQYLEADDIKVVMTRETGDGLYDENTDNKKVQDMKRRVAMIDETAPDVTVSIHQNSYPEEYVHGAQVFYYTGSKEGQRLAEIIQTQLAEKADKENKRQIKANDSYYLLKKTGVPIVIVECGFLSNRAEAEKLGNKDYQKELAWAIHLGIVQYLNE
ncbi:MAG: N-acetylmuramoyl-L-alanine amidase [Lachnoclostridium sp.]|nr:N-acetylmuramoyl-L-alanine amidase [Lachnospira sp.]MCM1248489.1 N-acetylmuramoyl-L-alanine amidase [Lachnoclostridium sp.]MCM1536134.1 N-acetylmuramoyl-L-alanine amidase [Clostridium sp.]